MWGEGLMLPSLFLLVAADILGSTTMLLFATAVLPRVPVIVAACSWLTK
jgi:hypothetical protein